MEKVVVSLGGSVLVPGDDDAKYLRDVTRLFRGVSSRVKLFVVTGGGRVARYYIEMGRSVGIRERTLDEFGIAVTRLNARLLSAALGPRANREPAASYAEASKLSKRFAIVVMGGTRPGHTTDRVAASLALFVGANRIVNATSVDGVYSADPKKDPSAHLLKQVRFETLVTLAGKGHRNAGPSVVFDPVAARVVARDRTPLNVVHGRDLPALRAAILGESFHGTRVTDE
ncbi:MAG: UMP kinase [Methanobacteriota archaeon]|nr:MAG: UMP kinase [Euryarchaeota archaeon]